MVLTGPDVSHWQGKVDWAKVAVGHHFAWFKATQGVRSVDAQFENNRAGVRRTGMVPGAYHFLDAEWEPRAQARHFVEVLGDLKGIMAALDVETEGGSNPTLDQVTTFVGEFKALAPGHPLVIYTSYGWWSARDHTGRGARLSPHLWHARYRSIESGYGDMYGGWTKPTFWQHTSTGSCPGISGQCDLNIFYGGRDALLALAAATGTTPPKEDILDMDETKLRQIIGSEVRDELNKALGEADPIAKRLLARIADAFEAEITEWGGEFRTAVRSIVHEEIAKAAEAKPEQA